MTFGEVCWSQDCKTADKENHICLWEGKFWCFKVANRLNKSAKEIDEIKSKYEMDITYDEQIGFGWWFHHFIDLFNDFFVAITINEEGIESEVIEMKI